MNNLPSTISSTSELTALILEVRTYTKWFGQYLNAQRAGQTLKDPQPELTPTASTMIREWGNQSPLSIARLDELIEELERIKIEAPLMTITLAAPATSEVRQSLAAWARVEIDPNMLINFRFNATILGGLVVRVGSRVYDWSFRRSIMANRQHFGEVIARV